ncbi:N-methylhydantoinase A [hydrothermal vent metagenome]|uniref:N-methylhydantoinase A n=1 Tax=hydrothermal vent metagenome TaxID=652676 RepID=A0A3B0XYW1_9ZZZZ
MPAPPLSLIPPEHCLEINTRLSDQGELLQSLQPPDIDVLAEYKEYERGMATALNAYDSTDTWRGFIGTGHAGCCAFL